MLRWIRLDLPLHRLFVHSSFDVRQGRHQRDLLTYSQLARSANDDDPYQSGDHASISMKKLGERSLYRRTGARRGTSMAEFALIAIPCLTLFFGIMNFAMALYDYDFVGY